MKFIEIWITCPSPDVAERIADELVEKQLVACANILGTVRSIYRWKNRVQHESEVPLVVKTRASYFDEVAACVTAMHPYDTPAIVAVPVERCNAAYGDWLVDSTQNDNR